MNSIFRAALVASLTLVLTSCESDPTTSTVTKPIETAVFGAASWAIAVDMFTDYQCEACIAFHKAIGADLKRLADENKVTLTYYHFPLSQIHQNARRDALASLCALSQGKFHEMKDQLYAWEDAQKNALTRDQNRRDLAAKIPGMDNAQFAQCLQEGWYLSQVDKEFAIGESRNVPGTPTVFVNGQIVNMQGNPQSLIALIENASKK